MNDERPIQVAVIGGGCGSIAAAFELTRPELRGRYQVTLYQQGWRLGGKGASGRGRDDRIEEHGLHIWMGFYENAFRLLRECYAELDRDPATARIATWRDAFFPDPLIGLADRSPDGRWLDWTAHLPPAPGTPGDPFSGPPRWSVADYLVRSAALVRSLLETAQMQAQASDTAEPGAAADASAPADEDPGRLDPGSIADRVMRFIRYGQLAALGALVQPITLLEAVIRDLPRYPESLVLRFLDAIGKSARGQLERLIESDHEMRRIWEVVDIMLAVMRGLVRFGIPGDARGFDAIDDYDCREWLRLNGASARSVDSAFVRALHDLAFAYEDGDATRPRVAAGQGLRGALRAFFTYRGAFFWKMNGGMGDMVFAPFYQVLERRGVRFEFFHRLENVELARPGSLGPDERPHVAALHFDVQAHVAGGGPYAPLVDVRGLPCWPAAPDYAQLVEGEQLRGERRELESHWDRRRVAAKTLQVTRDFDLVVLGVSIGAIPYVCREIVERDPRWRAMVERVRTTATQAFQIWMSADMKELGWLNAPVTLSGFTEPFDTWADMSHLAGEESFAEPPRAIAYFCSPLHAPLPARDRDDADYAREQRERVRRNAVTYLNRDIAHLWPAATAAPGEFRWDVLADASGARGEARFASQYWTANVNPTDRYALSLPGSLKYRISPLDPTYDNLTLAGDWTDCGFNQGCVEAAVMSGQLAAHAISGRPALEEIVGYDHP